MFLIAFHYFTEIKGDPDYGRTLSLVGIDVTNDTVDERMELEEGGLEFEVDFHWGGEG